MDGDLAVMKDQLQNTHNVESQLELFQKVISIWGGESSD